MRIARMDHIHLLLGLMAVCLAGVTLQAWRQGNERRDVALLGACAGMLGAGSALGALLF